MVQTFTYNCNDDKVEFNKAAEAPGGGGYMTGGWRGFVARLSERYPLLFPILAFISTFMVNFGGKLLIFSYFL